MLPQRTRGQRRFLAIGFLDIDGVRLPSMNELNLA
jgi:hypothetical protein